MLTFTTQSQLADAMAQMTRCAVLASSRAWTASALGSLSLWSALMLAPGARGQDSSVSAGGHDAGHGPFSSYRSGGGHAVAQIVVPGEDAASGFGVVGRTPVYNLLDAWRAAFGATKQS